MITIVGLVGETETGKDSIADIAIQEFGARRIAFADPIRNCALAIDPIIPIVLVDDEGNAEDKVQLVRLSDVVTRIGWREAKKLPEVRRLLQRIGTEMGREIIHEDLWINLGLKLLVAYNNGSGGELERFVITDVRFQNEADKIREFADLINGQAHFVRVTRPGHGVVNDHDSESSYDQIEPVNFGIDNDGSLEELSVKTRSVLEGLFN